jgi:hypothetical protein
MEMPSIKLPIQGVLANRVDDQLASVWRVLNEPGFNPPPPNPLRVVRRQNVPDELLFIKPLLIGLANRHNVLFDLETNRLAGWWIGDAARQRTRAKSWYWEPCGTHLLGLEERGQGEEERGQFGVWGNIRGFWGGGSGVRERRVVPSRFSSAVESSFTRRLRGSSRPSLIGSSM